MQITSKTKAMKLGRIIAEKEGKRPKTSVFCTGKYAFNGSVTEYYGKEVTDISWVHAVYPVRREDSTGPYVKLMAVISSD